MMSEYEFEDLDVEHKGQSFTCSGTLQFDYTPAEPDEPFGYMGATPGHGEMFEDITVTCLDKVEWEDEDGNLIRDMNYLPGDVAELKETIEGYFDANTDKIECQ
jgi:hypothetical protein